MKELKAMLADALQNKKPYIDVCEEIKKLKAQKEEIEKIMKESEFSSEMDKIDSLKLDIETDTQLLSDAIVTRMMEGKTVEIKDEKGNRFEPVIKANLKKA